MKERFLRGFDCEESHGQRGFPATSTGLRAICDKAIDYGNNTQLFIGVDRSTYKDGLFLRSCTQIAFCRKTSINLA